MKGSAIKSARVLLAILALPVFALAQWQGHSADTSHNNRISLLELTRVIELYNTRYGTVRSGCYVVDPLGEDGFAPDAARDPADAVTLSSYHSGDSNRDGKIGLLEFTRVIELYNYRVGTTRTGDYHAAQVSTNSEDGFVPGPVGTQQEQAISFPAIADLSVLAAPFNLSATASSGMPVTYSAVAGGGSIALVGSTVLLLAPGSVTIRASQTGNADVAPANPVDRTFLVIGANNGTLGADQSLWYDVNGDGIRDEIIRPNTNRFTLSIASTQFGSGWLNNFWTWRPTYYTPFQGTEQPATYPDFGWSWSISASLADIMFDSGGVDVSAWLKMEANYDYVFFQTGENNIANWPQAQINSLPRFIKTVAGLYYHILATNAQASDYLDSAIYPIRLSQPIGSIQINDSGGNTIIGNLPVNGTTELFLPSNNQVTLQVRDTANQFVSSTIHQIRWQIQDALGTILREGLGIDVDFDNLPIGALQLVVLMDTAAGRRATVRTNQLLVKKVEFVEASANLLDWNGDFEHIGPPPGVVGYPFSPRGWELNGANNPVTMVKDVRPTVNVTVLVKRPNASFSLRGYSQALGLDFTSAEQISTGEDQAVTIQSTTALPTRIEMKEGYIGWSATVGEVTSGENPSGSHKIYVTWEPPRGGSITLKRLDWAVRIANGAATVTAAAEKFRDELAQRPGFGNGTGLLGLVHTDNNAWKFLDMLQPGDCGSLANLAVEGLGMVGVGALGPLQNPSRIAWPTADGTPGFATLTSNSCRQQTTSQFTKDGELFWARLIFPGNRYEAFFTITDPTLKAYTVYPPGVADNQTWYYLQVLRIGSGGFTPPHDQFWVWDGNQVVGNASVSDGGIVLDQPHIPVPQIP